MLLAHLLAAIYWLGSTLFEAVVLGPATRDLAGRPWLNELQEALRPRLILTSRLALGLLLATGLANLWLLRWPLTDAAFWSSADGRTLLAKLVVVALLVLLVGLHSWVQIPALRRLRLAAAEAPPDAAAAYLARYARGRRSAVWMGRAIIVLALLAVYFGLALTIG